MHRNLHLVEGGRIGSIELLDVLNDGIIEISTAVAIEQDGVVGQLRTVRIIRGDRIVVDVINSRCEHTCAAKEDGGEHPMDHLFHNVN